MFSKPHMPKSRDTNALAQDTFTLTEGTVVISYPAVLSEDSMKDLKDYLDIFMRKVQRVGHDPHDHMPPQPKTFATGGS